MIVELSLTVCEQAITRHPWHEVAAFSWAPNWCAQLNTNRLVRSAQHQPLSARGYTVGMGARGGLRAASYAGDLRKIRLALQAGEDVDSKDAGGTTALMHASAIGCEGAMQVLLAAGAAVELKNNNGRSSLMLASATGREGAMQVLLAADADVGCKDNNGRTALMVASANGHEEAVLLLLESGAAVDWKDHADTTALVYANQRGHTLVVQVLLEAGAMDDSMNEHERMALMSSSADEILEWDAELPPSNMPVPGQSPGPDEDKKLLLPLHRDERRALAAGQGQAFKEAAGALLAEPGKPLMDARQAKASTRKKQRQKTKRAEAVPGPARVVEGPSAAKRDSEGSSSEMAAAENAVMAAAVVVAAVLGVVPMALAEVATTVLAFSAPVPTLAAVGLGPVPIRRAVLVILFIGVAWEAQAALAAAAVVVAAGLATGGARLRVLLVGKGRQSAAGLHASQASLCFDGRGGAVEEEKHATVAAALDDPPPEAVSVSAEEVLRALEASGADGEVGEGGSGKVFAAKLPLLAARWGRVAVKCASGLQAADILLEVATLRRCSHRNVLSLLGYCDDARAPCMITPLMQGGSLDDRLLLSDGAFERLRRLGFEGDACLDWRQRLSALCDAARGLAHLHSARIWHRDVKTANILLEGALRPLPMAHGPPLLVHRAVLSDVGLAKVHEPTLGGGTTHATTRNLAFSIGFVDPALLNSSQHSERTDAFGIGICILMSLVSEPAAGLMKGHDDDVCEAMEDGTGALFGTAHAVAGWPSDATRALAALVHGLSMATTKRRQPLRKALAQMEALLGAVGEEALMICGS